MAKFRKKPVVIEASQWFKNGDHPLDYEGNCKGLENSELRVFTSTYRKEHQWEGGIVRYFRRPDVSGSEPCKHCGVIMHDHGWIDTLEGGHIVCPGDWIITGVKGEHYPCKPDIFAATYEPADSPSAPAAVPREPNEAEDAARFAYWFSADAKVVDINGYLQGCREHWTLAQWRAFIDAAQEAK